MMLQLLLSFRSSPMGGDRTERTWGEEYGEDAKRGEVGL